MEWEEAGEPSRQELIQRIEYLELLVMGRERERRWMSLLTRLVRSIGETLDFDAAVDAIGQALVPAFADFCMIVSPEAGGELSTVAAFHPEPEQAEALRRSFPRSPARQPRDLLHATLASEAVLSAQVDDDWLERNIPDPAHRELLRSLHLRSTLLVPLVQRGHFIGAIRFARTTGSYDRDDVALAGELAAHAGHALDNARLFRLAQDAVTARENLMAVVSHDMRTPVSTIMLASEVLAKMVGPDVTRHLAVITRSAQRLDRLIGALRDATMIDAGTFTVRPRVQACRPLLDEMLESLRPLCTSREVELSVRVGEGIENLRCDRDRMQQVFANLIGNACEFTPHKGGHIDVSVEREGTDARFAVTDNGDGIAADHLPHVFDRFWKGPSRGSNGTGLGLFIVRNIVSAQGGAIWVESEPGRGTTFYFTVPLAEDVAPAAGVV